MSNYGLILWRSPSSIMIWSDLFPFPPINSAFTSFTPGVGVARVAVGTIEVVPDFVALVSSIRAQCETNAGDSECRNNHWSQRARSDTQHGQSSAGSNAAPGGFAQLLDGLSVHHSLELITVQSVYTISRQYNRWID